jgi:hypothetical protein
LTVIMPCAPLWLSSVSYWSKFTDCTWPESTSVLVFQLYVSEEVPPGNRIKPIPAFFIRPGTAASTSFES